MFIKRRSYFLHCKRLNTLERFWQDTVRKETTLYSYCWAILYLPVVCVLMDSMTGGTPSSASGRAVYWISTIVAPFAIIGPLMIVVLVKRNLDKAVKTHGSIIRSNELSSAPVYTLASILLNPFRPTIGMKAVFLLERAVLALLGLPV